MTKEEAMAEPPDWTIDRLEADNAKLREELAKAQERIDLLEEAQEIRVSALWKAIIEVKELRQWKDEKAHRLIQALERIERIVRSRKRSMYASYVHGIALAALEADSEGRIHENRIG